MYGNGVRGVLLLSLYKETVVNERWNLFLSRAEAQCFSYNIYNSNSNSDKYCVHVCVYIYIYIRLLFFFVSLEGQIKEVMHKAFWDTLAESLQEDPPDYSHALVLLKEIKEVIPVTIMITV